MTKQEYGTALIKIHQYDYLKEIIDWADILINVIDYEINEIRTSKKRSIKINFTVNGVTDSSAEFSVEHAVKFKELLEAYRTDIIKHKMEL